MTIAHDPSDPPRDPDQKFRLRVTEIATFREQYGRFPAGRSADSAERVLGRWLSNVRTTHRGNQGKGPTLNPDRVAILSELLPGWDAATPGNVADDDAFAARAQEAKAYLAEHGHLPTSSSPDADRLGAWLTRVRAASRGKSNMAWTPARAKLIEENLPGWLTGSQS